MAALRCRLDVPPVPSWNGPLGTRRVTATAGLCKGGRRAENHLGGNGLLPSSECWDSRRDKRHPQLPDFRQKLITEPLTWTNHSTSMCNWDADRKVGQGNWPGPPFLGPSLWSDEIQRLCGAGKLTRALDVLLRADKQGIVPSVTMYCSVLKACAQRKALAHAKQMQIHLVDHGLECTGSIGEHLVSTLVKCGGLGDALELFHRLPIRSVFSWTAIISGYTASQQCEKALSMYQLMKQEGVQPNTHTFVSLFKACASLKDLKRGKRLHAEAIHHRCEGVLFIGNCLVDMYGKCGSIEDAESVFAGLLQRDVVSWNAMLTAYVHQDHGEKAFQLYERMREEGVSPNRRTLVSVLQACGILAKKEENNVMDGRAIKIRSMVKGKHVHVEAWFKGYDWDTFVANTLVSMYGKTRSIEDAERVFHGLSQLDVVAWTVMLTAYAEQGQANKALLLYEQMLEEAVSPNERTIVVALQACGMLAAKGNVLGYEPSTNFTYLNKGKVLHADARRKGCDRDVFVANTLVSMYGKCGSIVDAQNVFAELSLLDVVSWNAMLMVFTDEGAAEEALLLYEHMLGDGISPNDLTLLSTIQACVMLAEKEVNVVVDKLPVKARCLAMGKLLHSTAYQKGYGSSLSVGNILIHMYCTCGSIADAQNVFDGLSQHSVVAWNLMLTAYTELGEAEKTLELYCQIRGEGVNPNRWTYVTTLEACGMLAEKEDVVDIQSTRMMYLVKGKAIHADAWRNGHGSDVFIGSILVEVYGKCGSTADAQNVFDELSFCDKAMYVDSAPEGHTVEVCGGHTFATLHENCGSTGKASTVFNGLSHIIVASWNSMLAAYAKQGQAQKILELYEHMRQENLSPNHRTFVTALQACSILAQSEVGEAFTFLGKGKIIHANARMKGFDSHIFLSNTLIYMYGKCQSISDAETVFVDLLNCDTVSWNAMLAAYVEQGLAERALLFYEQMLNEGVGQSDRTFVTALQACGMLAERANNVVGGKVSLLQMGKVIHAAAWRKGYSSGDFLCNSLISVYGKCDSILDALDVFDRLSLRNLVSCNTMLAAYVRQGQAEMALQVYGRMWEEGVSPDDHSFRWTLQACGMIAEKEVPFALNGQSIRVEALKKGKTMHAEIRKKGYDSDVSVGNRLLGLYGKCGSILDAQNLFDGLFCPNEVTWNLMLTSYLEHGHAEKALELYERMLDEGLSPTYATSLSALQACGMLLEKEDVAMKGPSKSKCYLKVKVIHADAYKKGYDSNPVFGSTLISLYGKYGSVMDSQNVFDGLLKPDVVAWTAMLMVYVQQGLAEKAVQLYEQMQEKGVSPDSHTFVSTLQACSMLADKKEEIIIGGKQSKVTLLQKGKEIHSEVCRKGYGFDVFVGNTLISMYGKCASIVDAKDVFERLWQRNVVSWNALLAVYIEEGEADMALQLYVLMREESESPNERTFVSVLQAFGMMAENKTGSAPDQQIKFLEQGKAIHADICRKGCDSNIFVSNSLLEMYGKCGSCSDAQNVFDHLSQPNVISWNLLLAAYAELGLAEKALQLYGEMQEEGETPDEITIIWVLQACRNMGSLEIVKDVHHTLVSTKGKLTPTVANTLISAYGRCASMEDAQVVFDVLYEADVVSWNAVISGYARQGDCVASLECYEKMLLSGVSPDAITFVSLLSACSHAGLVEKGVQYFESMIRDHGITPQIEHFSSMVDLFGRAGCFTEIEDLLSTMPLQPDLTMWLCLLGACQKYGKVTLGEHAFFHAVQLQPEQAAPYVLMVNIYINAGLLNLARKVNKLREQRRAWKQPGQSWIVHHQELRAYSVGNRKDPEHQRLYDLLRTASFELKREGVF